MNYVTKSALGVCLALVGVITVASLRSPLPRGPAPVSTPTLSAVQPAAAPTPFPASTPSEPAVLHASGETVVVPPLPANATHVPDEHLLKLSALVNLPNAEERRINNAQWTQALPIAKTLVQGPCDCEQRNWLNHFIEMGEAALAGSDEAYYKLAVLMPKMARNDAQLAEDPGRIAR